jgi:hypothetical protein
VKSELPVIAYDTDHVPDDRPGAGPRASARFFPVRAELVEVCRRFGSTKPEDRDADDPVYFVIDDHLNDERYQHVEVLRPDGLTADWVRAVAAFLFRRRGWGVGVTTIPRGYLLIFADKLMVTGPTFRGCRTVEAVADRGQRALEVDYRIRTCRTDADLERLTRLPGVARRPMRLEPRALSDAGVPLLARLQGVRWLTLMGSRVTDAGLAALPTLPRLEYLFLHGTRVGDAGLRGLSALPRLRLLDLEKTRVTDRGLRHLAGLGQLSDLALSDTRVTDAGLGRVGRLCGLTELSLSGCRVTDRGLAALAGLTRLERLVLQRTRVTDAGLAHVRGLRRLTYLALEGTRVTPEGAAALRQVLPECDIAVGRAW